MLLSLCCRCLPVCTPRQHPPHCCIDPLLCPLLISPFLFFFFSFFFPFSTDDDKPLILDVVKKAEAAIAADKSLNHEYLDISGDVKFCELSRAVLFGANSPAITEKRIVSAQSLSGTGALRLGCEFIARFLPKGTTIYV